MKKIIIKGFLVINLILAFLMTGCVTIVAKTEPAPTPTQSVIIVPTATQSTTVQPTQTPAVQPTVGPTATVQPALKEYTSKSNSFSVSYPADWDMTETLSSVNLTSADKSGGIYFVAVNTIGELDATAFTNFISAYEANEYAGIKNYKEVKREIQPDNNSAVVTATLDLNQIPSMVGTSYTKIGKVIYISAYFSNVSTATQWTPVFKQIVNSFKSNPAYAEDLIPYTSATLSYYDPKNLFTINLPATWTFNNQSTNTLSNFAAVSPDQKAIIVIQEENLGHEVTRPVGDAEALRLIKKINEEDRITHIDAIKDGTKDGTIQWSWATQNGSAQAVSLHKGIGNEFYMITFMIDKGFDFYQSTMTDLMTNTYKVAQ